jgi:hypothetical protein
MSSMFWRGACCSTRLKRWANTQEELPALLEFARMPLFIL